MPRPQLVLRRSHRILSSLHWMLPSPRPMTLSRKPPDRKLMPLSPLPVLMSPSSLASKRAAKLAWAPVPARKLPRTRLVKGTAKTLPRVPRLRVTVAARLRLRVLTVRGLRLRTPGLSVGRWGIRRWWRLDTGRRWRSCWI
jgi:hypothetical protein